MEVARQSGREHRKKRFAVLNMMMLMTVRMLGRGGAGVLGMVSEEHEDSARVR